MRWEVKQGNCLDVMREMDDNSVDAIVTDPPYGLSFMGKKWDYDVPSVDIWRECLRVLKPGGHLLAFAGTRTQHRMAVNIEDAGFHIRDMIAWVYGSGFPKSLDVSKAIDKAAGAKRQVIGTKITRQPTGNAYAQDAWTKAHGQTHEMDVTAPATDAAKQWQGWGTALKPALEPITVARKPLGGTVASNVLEHGTGALNIDGCRVGADDGATTARKPAMVGDTSAPFGRGVSMGGNGSPLGRWPANLIHDGSDEVVGLFPDTGGGKFTVGGTPRKTEGHVCTGSPDRTNAVMNYGDNGSAARFFYCAKASKRDRDEGCEGLDERQAQSTGWSGDGMPLRQDGTERKMPIARNHHPTVKPTALMRYLVRLVTPPDGLVLDPFCGSGSTGKAAVLEGFGFIGAELDPDYCEIARARIAAVDPDEVLK